MSKEARRVQIIEETRNTGAVLSGLLDQTEEKRDEAIGGIEFSANINPCKIKAAEIKPEVVKSVNQFIDLRRRVNKAEVNALCPAFEELGRTNVLVQAKNVLLDIERADLEFLKKCNDDIKEFDLKIATMKNNIAAIDVRRTMGQTMGEMGKFKEISDAEHKVMTEMMKGYESDLMKDLSDVLEHVFDDDVEDAKACINELHIAAKRQDGDPYIKVTADNRNIVGVLLECGVVEPHPTNAKKVAISTFD